jgi:DNA-binding NtrC family response regulator
MNPRDQRGAVTVGSRGAAQAATSAGSQDLAALVLYVHGSLRHRPAVRERLGRLGAHLTIASDIAEAMRTLDERRFELILVDLADDRGALAAIRMLKAVNPNLPVVGIVDPTSPATAAEALHAGIAEVLPWPFDERDVMAAVANARDRAAIDGRYFPSSGATSGLFAQSPVMRQVLEAVRGAAATRRGLLIVGEPGTGRQLIARAIHMQGPARTKEFVHVDCAASPADLEEQLFGTVAERGDDGRHAATERLSTSSALNRAHGGTLFLSNIAEAPARIQIRLSRVLRDREAQVGDGDALTELDVRPIAAVDADMDAAVGDGRLRRELVDRFPLSRLEVPPLRGRRDDIPLLAVHFTKETCEKIAMPTKSFSRAALALLSALPWNGNAHELRELIEALVRAVTRPVIQLDDVLDHAHLDGTSTRIDEGLTLRDAKARFERECISAVLIRHHGRVGEAAKALGIQRTNLYRKVRQLNVARSLLSARR